MVKNLGFRYGYIDIPTERKIHRQSIVRIGGISICVATLTALLIIGSAAGLTSQLDPTVIQFICLMIGSFAFFLIGLTDDLLALSPLLRLLIQFGIASLIWLAGVRIEFVALPVLGLTQLDWLSLPLTIIWITGVVNAINWLDGLDGLASGVTGIAALVMFIICLSTGQLMASLVMAALAGSLLGFLYYNFEPAQIFMGDSGSYFIGSAIAGTSVIILSKGATTLAIFIPILVLAVPILDMAAVILKRISCGRSPFIADKSHLHHRLLQAGLPHRLIVLFIYALSLWAGSLAITLAGIPNHQLFLAGATVWLAGISWRVWRMSRSAEMSSGTGH